MRKRGAGGGCGRDRNGPSARLDLRPDLGARLPLVVRQHRVHPLDGLAVLGRQLQAADAELLAAGLRLLLEPMAAAKISEVQQGFIKDREMLRNVIHIDIQFWIEVNLAIFFSSVCIE